MKKLFATLCVFSFVGMSASYASQATYTEKFIQSKTAGIVKKEKELQAKQAADKKALEAKKKAIQDKQAADKKALEAKKKAIQDKQAADKKALEAKKKEIKNKQDAHKKKVQQKKDAWKALTTY